MASKVDPQATLYLSVDKLRNNGRPKSGNDPAITDLNKSLPAKTDAKYLQKDMLK